MRRGHWAVSAAALSGLVLCCAPSAHSAPTADWFWEWSDGSRARARVIPESQHPTLTSMPALAVVSSPATPGRMVELQVFSDNTWRTEDTARTDRAGRALLHVNPYCSDGAWCSGTMPYRLRVEGITASLQVRFTPAPSP